jgi:hypothetical protein
MSHAPQNQHFNTFHKDLADIKHAFDEHRKYLRRSGITRAVILWNSDLASARIFLEVTQMSRPAWMRRRRYRVVIPYTEWSAKPAHLFSLVDEVDLAARLAGGYDLTNSRLCHAMKSTGYATKSVAPSTRDLLRLKKKRNRRTTMTTDSPHPYKIPNTSAQPKFTCVRREERGFAHGA